MLPRTVFKLRLYAVNIKSDRRYICRPLSTHCQVMSAHKNAGIIPYPMTLSEDGCRGEVVLPGYGFSDINRAGYFDLWATLRADESLRMRFLETTESAASEFAKDMLFLIGYHYHFKPALYRQNTRFQPVRTICDCAFFGKSSFDFHHIGFLAKTGETLHSGRAKVVVVDKETHKSLLIPQEIVARFRKTTLFQTLKPMNPFEQFSCPAGELIHKKGKTIQPSEADFYLHTNHASYPKLCHDAASLVAMEGRLRHMPGDLAFYPVKELTCLFQSETKPGDKVDVNFWEEQPMMLKFIVKKDDTSVFQCTMIFYESVTSNI